MSRDAPPSCQAARSVSCSRQNQEKLAAGISAVCKERLNQKSLPDGISSVCKERFNQQRFWVKHGRGCRFHLLGLKKGDVASLSQVETDGLLCYLELCHLFEAKIALRRAIHEVLLPQSSRGKRRSKGAPTQSYDKRVSPRLQKESLPCESVGSWRIH